jgi:DNA polymerase-3 subunit delta'
MQFKEVIGHSELKQQLIKTVQKNKISHAQLFSGKEGAGHFPLAVAYAQYVLCKDQQENDSCGECPSCKKTAQFIHPDLHFSFPVHLNKTNKVQCSDDLLNEFRKMLLEDIYIGKNHWYNTMGNQNKQGVIGVTESENIVKKLSLKSFEGGYKIMIMWLPESMNLAAGNKLLKIIEEPPPNTLYLLITDDKEKIIKTILSRTQPLNFSQVNEEEVKQYISNKFSLNSEEATHFAKLADGNLHKVRMMLEHHEEKQEYLKEFAIWMRLCYSRNITETIDWVDKVNGMGREVQKDFLLFCLEMFRQSFIGHYTNGQLLALSQKQQQFLSKFAIYIHHNNIADFHEEINKAYYHLERNANPKVLFLDLSLKIFSLLKRSTDVS